MNIDLPKNQAVNETITAVSEINSNSLIIISIIIIILIITFFLLSSFSMFGAYK